MRRFLIYIALTLCLITAASAQSTKSALQTLTNSSFPTQLNGSITPSIMNTWASAAINSFQQFTGVNAQTGASYPIQASDYGQLVTFCNTGAIAATIPQGSVVAGFYPFNFYVTNLCAGAVTITPTTSTINGAPTLVLAKGQSAQIVSDGTNYQTVLAGQNAINLVIGTTTISGGTTNYLLYNNGGTFANETIASVLTAGTGIGITGTTNATIANNGVVSANTLTGALTLANNSGGTVGSTGTTITFSDPGGFLNVLRNSSLTAWFHGCVAGACTATTTAATTNWCAEGVFVIPTGANVTCQATATVPTGSPGYYGVKITGAASNTDIKVRFPIESYSAAKIDGLVTTFQFTFINNSGSTITPALSTKYPTTQDGGVTGGAAWGASTADLSATNLTACTNGSTCLEGYTFTVNAAANNGYEFVVDFGAMASGSDTITLGGGFDARATPGVTTGINLNPPPPEVRNSAADIEWCERFFADSFGNGIALGASTHNGIVSVTSQTSGTFALPFTVYLPVQMRAAPTIAYWDGAGNASKLSYITLDSGSASFTDDAANAGGGAFDISQGNFGFFGFVAATSGTAFIHYTADASLWGG